MRLRAVRIEAVTMRESSLFSAITEVLPILQTEKRACKGGLLPVKLGSFFGATSIVGKNPLIWCCAESCSTPAGEAETSSAGEHPAMNSRLETHPTDERGRWLRWSTPPSFG